MRAMDRAVIQDCRERSSSSVWWHYWLISYIEDRLRVWGKMQQILLIIYLKNKSVKFIVFLTTAQLSPTSCTK